MSDKPQPGEPVTVHGSTATITVGTGGTKE